MASGNVDSSNSEDEIFYVIRKRRCKRKNVVNSDSDNDSDCDIRPRATGVSRQICDSESSTDDEDTEVSSSLSRKRHSPGVEACQNTHTSVANDSSDGEQSEKCVICLSKFLGQDVATPEMCDHTFCAVCLEEWAKKVNTCPIDRQEFHLILVRHHGETKISKTISLKTKANQTDEDDIDVGEDSDYADVINCIVCGDSNEPSTIIMCNQCRLVYHRDCINPPLLGYPLSNPWQCPICRNLRLIVRGRFRPSTRHLALPGLLDSPNNQLRSRSRNNTPNLNDSSSTDSSDENTELSSSFNRRRQCQEIRNRRQSRIPRHRFNAPTLLPFSHSPLQQTDGFLASMDSGEEIYDYNCEHESVVSRVRRRAHQRVKTVFLSPGTAATPVRPSTNDYSTSTDIVGDILQLQTALHTPGGTLQRDGTLIQSTVSSGQQCPLNPAHSTPSKCNNNTTSQQNSTFAGSSSSSSGSGSSQCRDLYSMPACSMLQSNVNNDGYDTDSCSMVTHRSYGSSSVPEELKRDGRESFSKDASKTHSDEEVDIYSDIELTNEDETSLDTEMQAMSVSYKSDESHLAPAVGDGSDSSDNDLVIDEDIQAEEDGEKARCLSLNKSCDDTPCNSSEMIEKNDSSSNSELDEADQDDPDQETSDKLHENETIQSPNHLDDVSQNSNAQGCNDSCDSFKKSSDDREQMSVKDNVYGDSEADSRDVNSTGNEADEENSIHSLKASGFEEHSEVFEPNNSSNGEESQKLSFNLESAASQIIAESQSNSQSSGDQQAHDLGSDCSTSAVGINLQENMSENEELSTDNFDNNFQNDVDMDSYDKSDGTHLEDSDCSGSSRSVQKQDSVNDTRPADVEQLEYDYTNEIKNTSVDACASDATAEKMSDENAVVESNILEKEFEKEVDSPKNSVESVGESTPTPFDHEDSACNLGNGDEGVEEEDDDDANSNKESSCIGSPEGDAENADKSVDLDTQSKNQENSVVHSPGTQNIDDLGIEDISDAASDDLNQPENSMDCDQFPSDNLQSVSEEVEKNVAQLFESDSPPEHISSSRDTIHQPCLEDTKRQSSSSRQSAHDDHEEGEIIDDLPYPKKENRHDYYGHEEEDFMDSTPRLNISDLPRIPKIKRDNSKTNEPEEIPLEAKRTSVLGRVDLGNSDISWKRLSQHTRERSYRDGRPKDDSILFRDREPRVKDRKSKNEDKYRESERSKKRDLSKSRERSSKDHKSERTKGEYDKSSRQFEKSYSTPEKREKEKYRKSYDRLRQDKYDRDQSKSERESSKKEKREKYKDKSSREDDKYERDKCRAEEKYKRDAERYELTSDRYDRSYEKIKEKEYKTKHKDHRDSKDHKSDSSSSKKNKDEKRKHSHSSEHYSEKQKEREVRKVDDKLKIVVEHKEVKKDKGEKHFDKKHEKKHRDSSHHHHERKKKEHIASPYSDVAPTPIESKEIFAKGDSIIINVNFNRASPREVFPPSASADEVFSREKKSSLSTSSKIESVNFVDESGKSKHPLHEKENIFVETSGSKRPSTPDERIEKNSTLSVGESYWRETDDTDANSPSAEKCSIDKNASDEENCTPVENYGADDNLTDSDDSDNLPETQLILSKTEDEFSEIPTSDRQIAESGYLEDKEADCFNSSRRSPQPPSPPSPADNDSYDPCEPTRSPSPPPSPPPVPPPLPSKSIVDHPKPPPSPELPPLPPGPEPTDVIPREDPRSVKTNSSSQPSEVMSVSSPMVTQQQVVFTQTTTAESSISVPSVLMPPPSFPPRSTSMATTVTPQPMPPKTVNWQVPNPPPAPLMFPPNHVHPVIRGNFLPSHIPTMGMPPQNASATILPPTNSVPLMSQVRHLQMTTHGVMPNNQLIANVPLNIPQMHITHMNHPSPNAMSAHHQLASMQSHPNSLSASNVVRVLPVQSQLPNIAVTIQNQHMVSVMQNQTMGHFIPQQSQGQTPATAAAHKPEKVQKSSPTKEKSEVVDMDVDSPYSPGDSPSMDSNYDYSPPTSPIQKTPPSTQLSKDPFDTLLGPDRQDNNKMTGKSAGKVRSSNCSDTPSKKAKLDSKSDSNKSRHSIRLQVDKGKSRKEQKISEKKEILSKLDDTQLKILDELPSSAVEMQVKEKFLKKLNRQERVVEEVKLVLKPYYKTREVNKEEYKDILRKSVPKICHNKSGEINPVKVKHLVESYVKKVKHARKKASKRHKASKYS